MIIYRNDPVGLFSQIHSHIIIIYYIYILYKYNYILYILYKYNYIRWIRLCSIQFWELLNNVFDITIKVLHHERLH